MDQKNEVMILGAGPAGIAAAIYLKRARIHPILLETSEPGGILRYANRVENYPGFPQGIKGMELVERFEKQLHKQNVTVTKTVGTHLSYKNEVFLLKTNQGTLCSSVSIIATGTRPKKPGIRNADSIEGTRLFYDPFSIPLEEKSGKKRILVIGGGDIAFDYAATLLHGGHEVTIISRSEPTCLPLLCDRALKNGATLHSSCVPEQLVKHRKDIHLTCRQNNQETRFFADFILIACGREPNISFLSSRLKEFLQSTQNIPQTVLPGFYVAGDVVRGAFRQTGIAVGDGIHAAMMVEQYLKDRTVRP